MPYESAICPIPNAHSRLDECHRLWHRADDAYDDPDEFRTDLNALLQALRNVTFVLQREKRQIPDFESWYGPWQETLGKDSVLRWLVQARNHVVKEGDLDTFSTATAGIRASWDEPQTATFEVPPLMPTYAIAATLAEHGIPEPVREEGLLIVERRWVARTLPDHELLEALAHCFELLARLISDAHRQAGIPMHSVSLHGQFEDVTGGRPSCMVGFEDQHRVVLNLRTKETLRVAPETIPPVDPARTLARYGHPEAPPKSSDPLEWASVLMEQAKRVLARDKWHAQYAFLFYPDGPPAIRSFMPEDQQDKYLHMEEIAKEVRRSAATGVVFIADTWFALEQDVPPDKRATAALSRREALAVDAVRSDGTSLSLLTLYKRDSGVINFDETVEVSMTPLYLAPVLRVWNLPAPSEREEQTAREQRWRELRGNAGAT